MQASVFDRTPAITKPPWFIMGFMCFFFIVIALAKDIPDVGDKVFGIHTLQCQSGSEKGFLDVCWTTPGSICISPWLFGAELLWSQNVDLKSRAAITSWYMFIWKLFYAEYFLITPMI